MPNTKDSPAKSPAQELLNRKKTGSGPHPPNAMDHLALGVMVANGAEADEALAALTRLHRHFVDWNEIRVARVQELARSLGDFEGVEKSAKEIKDEYNAFFDKKGALNFDFLAAGKPAETRRHLNQVLPRLHKGAAALLLYEFCPGASLPLSDEGLRQARRDGVVAKSGDRNQLSRALAESVELSEAALLVQYWELEGTGSPYGEPLRKETAAGARKGRKGGGKAAAKK